MKFEMRDALVISLIYGFEFLNNDEMAAQLIASDPRVAGIYYTLCRYEDENMSEQDYLKVKEDLTRLMGDFNKAYEELVEKLSANSLKSGEVNVE